MPGDFSHSLRRFWINLPGRDRFAGWENDWENDWLASNAADNGPDQGHLMAAAGSWRTDGTQREPEMRIGVRVGAIRCFSAPQPRSASLPRRLRCHCSSAPLPAFPRPGARSRPFDPAAVRIGCLFVYPRGSLCCFGCSQVKGRTEGASDAVVGVSSRSPRSPRRWRTRC